MKFKSFSKDLKGCVKEILGTAFSVGCQVDGKSPRAITEAIDAGEIDSTFSSSAGASFLRWDALTATLVGRANGSLTWPQFLRSKLVVNEDRFGNSWHVIRSSGLALHQACQTTANQIKRTISWPSVGVSARNSAPIAWKREKRFGRRSACPSPPPPRISQPPPHSLWMKLSRVVPGRSLRNRPLPMVLSAFCAQEDKSLTAYYSPWLPWAHLCCGSQGPYFRPTFHALLIRPAVVRRSHAMVSGCGIGEASRPTCQWVSRRVPRRACMM